MPQCEICRTLDEPGPWEDIFIHRDDLVVLAHVPPDERGGYPGHLLLLPRRHVESPGGLTAEEAERVGLWLARGSRALESALGAEHVYWARLGDGWPHLHFHLIGRYRGTPVEYRGLNVRDWKGVARIDRAKTADLAEALRQALR